MRGFRFRLRVQMGSPTVEWCACKLTNLRPTISSGTNTGTITRSMSNDAATAVNFCCELTGNGKNGGATAFFHPVLKMSEDITLFLLPANAMRHASNLYFEKANWVTAISFKGNARKSRLNQEK